MSVFLKSGVDAGYTFIYDAPQDYFVQQIKLLLTIAFFITSPVLVMETIMFVAPAFSIKARQYAFVMLIFYGMLSLGMGFSYHILLPFALKYLAGMGGAVVVTTVTIEKYISFVIMLIAALGFVFEIPLIITLLSKYGIVDTDMLKSARRVVVVITFIVAAVLTPPDVVSQFVVAIPILILYEVSIVISRVVKKRRIK